MDEENENPITLYLEYTPSFITHDSGEQLPSNINNVSIGVNYAYRIAQHFYVEPGLAAQVSFWNEKENSTTHSRGDFQLKVPLNVVGKWRIGGTSVNVLPFLGLNMRGSIANWSDLKDDREYQADYPDLYNLDHHENALRRFMFGWQAGVKFNFSDRFIVGAAYGSDFTKFQLQCRLQSISVAAGIIF